MIKGIAHVCIGSKDLTETEKFYCEGLGFKKKFNFVRKDEVIGFYMETGDGVFVEVFKRDEIDPSAQAPISHLCLQTNNIDAVRASLGKAGYKATEKKMGADQSWQSWVTDPCGVKIEFHQYTAKSSQCTGADCMLD